MNIRHLVIVTLVASSISLSGCVRNTAEMYIGAYQGDVRLSQTVGNDGPTIMEFNDHAFTLVKGNNADLLLQIDSCILPATLEKEGFTIDRDSPCTYVFEGATLNVRTNGDGMWDSRDRLQIEITQTGAFNMDSGASHPYTARYTVVGRRL
jgi:hypothetical protein